MSDSVTYWLCDTRWLTTSSASVSENKKPMQHLPCRLMKGLNCIFSYTYYLMTLLEGPIKKVSGSPCPVFPMFLEGHQRQGMWQQRQAPQNQLPWSLAHRRPGMGTV